MSFEQERASSSWSGVLAQTPSAVAKAPAAQCVAEFNLKDAEAMKPYAAAVSKIVESYAGVALARGGRTQALEGVPPKRVVVIRFDSMDAALRWYHSPQYAAIRPHRQKAGETRNFLVEGLE